MPGLDYAANPVDVPRGTLVELFLDAIDEFGGSAAFRYFDGSELKDISYLRAFSIVKLVAAALESHGVMRGDRAAILSENRPEWALADYGCLCAGVIDVPIYATLTAAQVAYALRDSGAKLLFCSDASQLAKAMEACETCPQDVRVVVFDEGVERPSGVMGWREFLAGGDALARSWTDTAFRIRARQAAPDDVATMLYTSGTTGDPKGVMLTHDNVSSNVRACTQELPIGRQDTTLSFLPLSHILQRMVDYLFFWVGCSIAYARSVLTVIEDMQTVRPSVVVSVPRLYEKIYNGVRDVRGVKRSIVEWALDVADRAGRVRLNDREPPAFLAARYAVADRLVFSRVKAALGGRLRFFVSGGAPLAQDLNRFFYSIGLLILEGYGLTETTPVTNVNTPERFRIGTVGPPVPGTEIRIAQDGEILVRGRQVMKGYYNKPEATAEAIDPEGWFHTGDVGEIDRDGFLRITDRKKDLIVTAGGKNVAPQPIENRLKTSRYVEQAVLVGDGRKFVSLLVVPGFPALEAWAAEQGISVEDRRRLLEDARVQAHMEHEVATHLRDLASFETPKKIVLLADEFTIEDGSLTPTLKVKRRVVEERFAHAIDTLYTDEGRDRTIWVA